MFFWVHCWKCCWHCNSAGSSARRSHTLHLLRSSEQEIEELGPAIPFTGWDRAIAILGYSPCPTTQPSERVTLNRQMASYNIETAHETLSHRRIASDAGLLPMDFGVLPRQAVDAQQSHSMSKPLASLSSDPSIPLVCNLGREAYLGPKLTSAQALSTCQKPWHGSPLCISFRISWLSRATRIFNMSCAVIFYRAS